MKTHQITVDKEGMGRPVNPFSPYDPTHEPGTDYSRFDWFSKTNASLPAFTPDNKIAPDGEYEAELVWQLKLNDEWYNSVEPTAYNKDYYRQIYRILPKEESHPQRPKEQQWEGETLEQAAKKQFESLIYDSYGKADLRVAFIAGANWQKHQSPIQQQPASSDVTAEKILAKHTGANVEYLDNRNRIIMAMHEYATLKNAELQKEVTRKREG